MPDTTRHIPHTTHHTPHTTHHTPLIVTQKQTVRGKNTEWTKISLLVMFPFIIHLKTLNENNSLSPFICTSRKIQYKKKSAFYFHRHSIFQTEQTLLGQKVKENQQTKNTSIEWENKNINGDVCNCVQHNESTADPRTQERKKRGKRGKRGKKGKESRQKDKERKQEEGKKRREEVIRRK